MTGIPPSWGQLKCWVVLIIALTTWACDRPAPPTTTPPPAPLPSAPPPGILRLNPGPLPPEITRKPEYRDGLPSLCLHAEYAGPKRGLRVEVEAFEHGRSRTSDKNVRAVGLPLSAEVAFTLGESKNAEGVLLSAVIERTVTATSPSGVKSATFREEAVSQTATPPIGTRPYTQVQPAWPLEIAEGQEPIIWGVFVGEPVGTPAGSPPEERARRAEGAWIFKVSMADMPKKGD